MSPKQGPHFFGEHWHFFLSGSALTQEAKILPFPCINQMCLFLSLNCRLCIPTSPPKSLFLPLDFPLSLISIYFSFLWILTRFIGLTTYIHFIFTQLYKPHTFPCLGAWSHMATSACLGLPSLLTWPTFLSLQVSPDQPTQRKPSCSAHSGQHWFSLPNRT